MSKSSVINSCLWVLGSDNHGGIRWVEDVVVFQPELAPQQSVLERGLLEAGIAPYNGFTFNHFNGTTTTPPPPSLWLA